jgi:hypothetical protein
VRPSRAYLARQNQSRTGPTTAVSSRVVLGQTLLTSCLCQHRAAYRSGTVPSGHRPETPRDGRDRTSVACIIGHGLITKTMRPPLSADVPHAAISRACSRKRGLIAPGGFDYAYGVTPSMRPLAPITLRRTFRGSLNREKPSCYGWGERAPANERPELTWGRPRRRRRCACPGGESGNAHAADLQDLGRRSHL